MIAFIIQARLGSTRFPKKIVRPFYNGESILEIIIDKLQLFSKVKIIIATSIAPENDLIEAISHKKGCMCFRGEEDDVLERFIKAAEWRNIEHIIRICSDNPFLNTQAIKQLLDSIMTSNYDYISFDVDGTPAIKTHFGFWPEYVKLSALKKVRTLTSERLYHEHVTNFIYAHPELFRLKWLTVPDIIHGRKDIRLTIDTQSDFERAQQVYTKVGRSDASIYDILTYLDSHIEIIEGMKQEILKNKK